MIKKDLASEAKISPTTMATMGKGGAVSLETLGRICIVLDCNIGDIVEVMDEYGTHKITISHIAKYYLTTPTLFMDMETYDEQFNNGQLFTNGLIVKRNNVSIKDINTNIKDIEGYIYTYDIYGSSIKAMDSISGAFTFMSFLYLFMSIAMAFLVILNLLVTFVNEKKKDLITLMINGYDRKDAKKYIYSEKFLAKY